MADTVKTASSLKWELNFADGDTRAVTLKNPRSNVTLADLTTVMSTHGSIFAGDQNGASYTGFTNPRIVDVTTRILDIE